MRTPVISLKPNPAKYRRRYHGVVAVRVACLCASYVAAMWTTAAIVRLHCSLFTPSPRSCTVANFPLREVCSNLPQRPLRVPNFNWSPLSITPLDIPPRFGCSDATECLVRLAVIKQNSELSEKDNPVSPREQSAAPLVFCFQGSLLYCMRCKLYLVGG